MPVFLDRKSEVKCSLKRHADLPEAERPYFLRRPHTGRDLRYWNRCKRIGAQSADDKEQIALVYRMAAVGTIGWGNIERPDGTEIKFPGRKWIEPGPDADEKMQAEVDAIATWLEALLTPEEALELINGVELNAQDRKKSESQPSTGQDGSATPASPEASV